MEKMKKIVLEDLGPALKEGIQARA